MPSASRISILIALMATSSACREPKPVDRRVPAKAAPAVDRDQDGLPDAAELRTETERASFARWFTAIAESQAVQTSNRWPHIHRDCAGLVRFSTKEALREHDNHWLKSFGYLIRIDQPDLLADHFPVRPVVGDLVFRATPGPFDPNAPRQSQMTAAPSARVLWQHNATLRSRSIDEARSGDLLFFSTLGTNGAAMHSMIVLGRRPGADHRMPGTRVVYHTGTSADDQGEVRLVHLDDLLRHPELDWRPTPDNPHFLGVYQLNLMTQPASEHGPFSAVGSARTDPEALR